MYDVHKGNYASRRIYLELCNPSFLVDHKNVQRLMIITGFSARIHRKHVHSPTEANLVKS